MNNRYNDFLRFSKIIKDAFNEGRIHWDPVDDLFNMDDGSAAGDHLYRAKSYRNKGDKYKLDATK